MAIQLYRLEKDMAHPCSTSEYAEWHDNLPEDQQIQLGQLLLKDSVGDVTATTIFFAVPFGHHGRRVQLWATITTGPGFFKEQLYTSHRAAGNGHRDTVAKLKKQLSPNLAIAASTLKSSA